MRQFPSGEVPESYISILRNSRIINVIPDPDVPSGCDANSAEYVAPWFSSLCAVNNLDKIMFSYLFMLSVSKSLQESDLVIETAP